MKQSKSSNDLQEILTQALDEMKQEEGENFRSEEVNLSELSRRTGISYAKLRRFKANGFIVKPHGNTGRKVETTVLTGFTGVLDEMLKANVTNAVVCFEKLQTLGYRGGQTQVRVYIENHKDLIPAKRQLVTAQGSRGQRFETMPGEAFQMDWGFTNVENGNGNSYRAACFVMICHHCGKCYVEFFPNAKQENLFIGMIHGFYYMGIPGYVLTDNMKSVVIRRDTEGKPVWQHDYETFMKTVGFQTKLCKPRHPFTKGKVERLIRFVKQNFLSGRACANITELNEQALEWCETQNHKYHRATDCVPDEKHGTFCQQQTSVLKLTPELYYYLCPVRMISFDGFVNYEGRRFGVPYWYGKKICRIQRRQYEIILYDDEMTRVLATYNVTWSRRDQFCKDQYVASQPEELPTMPVKSRVLELEAHVSDPGFEAFNFGEDLWND